MKILALACRILLGLMFFVFGLNNLLHFLKMPPPSGDALTWIGIMGAHHWMDFVGVIMVVAGLLLLVNRFVGADVAGARHPEHPALPRSVVAPWG